MLETIDDDITKPLPVNAPLWWVYAVPVAIYWPKKKPSLVWPWCSALGLRRLLNISLNLSLYAQKIR